MIYDIKRLDLTSLPAVMALQEVVLEALPIDQKNVILEKSKEDFALRMTDLGTMFGVFKGNTLIAYTTLALPNAKWPVADMVIQEKDLLFDPCNLGVLQNSVVHPKYREKHIHAELIKARVQLCKKLKRENLMSEIAVVNPSSLAGIVKSGFKIIAADEDPADGCKLFFLHKNISVPEAEFSKDGVWMNPYTHYSSIKNYLSKGWSGVSIKRFGNKNKYQLLLTPKIG